MDIMILLLVLASSIQHPYLLQTRRESSDLLGRKARVVAQHVLALTHCIVCSCSERQSKVAG